MKVTRLDLDGTGSPMGLVAKILQVEKGLTIPVKLEALTKALDIEDIRELSTEAFEGGLLTDDVRSRGIILVNKRARGGRRRFTIGHELGHFLMLWHRPVRPGEFLCSRADMMRWSSKDNDRYARMEVEANQFSALLLMPPPFLRKFIDSSKDPNLERVIVLSDDFEVSKEAAARAYAEYHHETVAIAVIKDGVIERIYSRRDFPTLSVRKKDRVPNGSAYYRLMRNLTGPSDIVETNAGVWLEVERGRRAPELFEQVLPQARGFAMVLIWIEQPEEEENDPDENRTSKERLADRLSRYR